MSRPEWTATDVTDSEYVGILEFQDNKGEWHNFEVVKTATRVVFGGACNVGFLESGYIEREDDESLEDTLCEMDEDLEVYYNDGPGYVSRIVVNERM